MKYDHVITFRMDEELLAQLDDFTHTHSYWKRSFILVCMIKAFLKYASAGTRFAIIRAAFERKKKYVLTFEEVTDEGEKS